MSDVERDKLKRVMIELATVDDPDNVAEVLNRYGLGLCYMKPEPDEQRAEREKQEADETRFYCPHCHAYKPEHLFNMQVANLAGIGTVHWLIAICGKCHVIITELLLGYQMDPDLLAAVKAGGGRGPRIIS